MVRRSRVVGVGMLPLMALLMVMPPPAEAWNLRLFHRNNSNRGGRNDQRRPRSTTQVDAAPSGAGPSSGGNGPTGTGTSNIDSSPLFADLMGSGGGDVVGKLDQARQWYQREILPRLPNFVTDTVPTTLVSIWTNLKALMLYKPPVGIVSVYLTFRLLVRSQRKRQLGLSDVQIQEEKSTSGYYWTSRRSRRQKPLDLDLIDRDYDTYGTVENVRGELASKALEGTTCHYQYQAVAQREWRRVEHNSSSSISNSGSISNSRELFEWEAWFEGICQMRPSERVSASNGD